MEEITNQQSEVPNFADMPKPVPIVVLSWEDIMEVYYNRYNRYPTREKTIEIFKRTERSMADRMMEDFWLVLDDLTIEVEEGEKFF